MKDLKHLIWFENLLENADNELIRQAKAEGRKCLGTICYQLPEPLLNLAGCFSVRLIELVHPYLSKWYDHIERRPFDPPKEVL